MSKPKKEIIVTGRVLIVAIVLFSVITVAIGSYVMHYLITRPSTITVGLDKFKTEIYTDPECTNVATQITFPEVMYSHYSPNVVTCASYYIKGTTRESGGVVDLTWESVNLSPDLVLSSEYKNGTWQAWDEATEYATLTDSLPVLEVVWTIDFEAATENQTYNFTMKVEAYEET